MKYNSLFKNQMNKRGGFLEHVDGSKITLFINCLCTTKFIEGAKGLL
jgi:hypothetical protein